MIFPDHFSFGSSSFGVPLGCVLVGWASLVSSGQFLPHCTILLCKQIVSAFELGLGLGSVHLRFRSLQAWAKVGLLTFLVISVGLVWASAGLCR